MIRLSALHTAAFVILIAHSAWAAEPDPSRLLNAKSHFDAIAQTQPIQARAMIFVGSSSIAMWRRLFNDVAPFRVVNRGVSGSTLAEWARGGKDLIIPVDPIAVVLYAGENDLAAGATPEQVLADFKRFVSDMRRALPDIPIAFMSIKPSPARWALRESMHKTNELVKASIAGGKNLWYVDVAGALLDKGGVVRPELFLPDRLHLNAEGYRLWAEILKPPLKEISDAARNRKSAPKAFDMMPPADNGN